MVLLHAASYIYSWCVVMLHATCVLATTQTNPSASIERKCETASDILMGTIQHVKRKIYESARMTMIGTSSSLASESP
jgi:hypothetical protein